MAHQIDDPGEGVFRAHRDGYGQGLGPQLVAHLLQHGAEVGPHAVHLVDKGDLGHPVAVGLVPHRLGLGLHPAHRAEHRDDPVQHPKAALHLDGEVHVPRGVDDVQGVALPLAGGGRAGDGDAPLLLLGHPVHDRGALVHLAYLVGAAGVVEHPLGEGGLARVDVGHHFQSYGFFSGGSSPAMAGVLLLVQGKKSAAHYLAAVPKTLYARPRVLVKPGGLGAGLTSGVLGLASGQGCQGEAAFMSTRQLPERTV